MPRKIRIYGDKEVLAEITIDGVLVDYIHDLIESNVEYDEQDLKDYLDMEFEEMKVRRIK